MTVLFSENSSEDLMAEKRPDQHHTDPGEAGSSDYKMRREGHTEMCPAGVCGIRGPESGVANKRKW